MNRIDLYTISKGWTWYTVTRNSIPIAKFMHTWDAEYFIARDATQRMSNYVLAYN